MCEALVVPQGPDLWVVPAPVIAVLEVSFTTTVSIPEPVPTPPPRGRRLHLPSLLAFLNPRLGRPLSRTTLWRILDEHALKPWRFRYWIFPRDPQFVEKAGPVLDLYAGGWDGQPLGPDEFVLSVDEKTSIQARIRCHPTVPADTNRPTLIEFEYERGGALQYLAGWDVHRGQVFGLCEPKTGIDAFHRLLDHLMSQEPYRSAKRVFVIVDNGSSHRGQASIDRVTVRYPNVVLVHLPTHASWLNQIEIYFSIVQRLVLTANDFASLAEVTTALEQFRQTYNQTAKPFGWKFTRTDLDKLMNKLRQFPLPTSKRKKKRKPKKAQANL